MVVDQGFGLPANSDDIEGVNTKSSENDITALSDDKEFNKRKLATTRLNNNVILTPSNDIDPNEEDEANCSYMVQEALILQLGSFYRYKLYTPLAIQYKTGDIVECHLYKKNTNPVSYVLLPISLNSDELPSSLRKSILFTNSNDRENDDGMMGIM